jgi:hypothetical protein
VVGQAGASGWQQENMVQPPVAWTRKQVSLVFGGSHKVGE